MSPSELPSSLPHVLARSVTIRARRPTVFRFFTDSELFARWWGAGSAIEPRPGGAVRIRYPNGVEVAGEVVEIEPERRIVFTYGYVGGQPIAPGGSRVEIALEESAQGTVVHLRHFFAEAAVRDEHLQGWRFQLALFANAAADVEHAAATARIDAWFALWSEPDDTKRGAMLAGFTTDGIEFRDPWACLAGRADLEANLIALLRFVPGARVARVGKVRHCQGEALADWKIEGGPGGRGTNLFRFTPDGRIASVTGFWSPASP